MTTETETLISGREVAKRAGVTVKTVVRYAIAGKIQPDFRTSFDRLLFRTANVANVVQALTK